MQNLLQDLRFGWRLLRKSPVFAAAAVLTLALGVGVNTAIFSVIEATLLRPLPYPHANRLVHLEWRWARGGSSDGLTTRQLRFWRRRSVVFSSFGEASYAACNLVYGGQRVYLQGDRVSAGFFPTLGVVPELGRGFSAVEDQAGGPRAILLSDHLWRSRFAAAPAILGRQLDCNGTAYTIIGVIPAGAVRGQDQAAFWVPLRIASRQDIGYDFGAVARLKPGWTLGRANIQMAAVARQYFRRYLPHASLSAREGVRLVPYSRYLYGDIRAGLLTLLYAVGLVLLIACANLAGLLLARAARRGPEVALRSALGATRGRLLRQFLAESLWLGILGGAASLLLAAGGVALIRMYYPAHFPPVRLDWRLLAYSFALAAVAALVAALAPAWSTARASLAASLQPAGWHAVGAGRQRGRRLLVVGQIALSLSLLSAAGLMLRVFYRMATTPLGFHPRALQLVRLPLIGPRYATAAGVWQFDRQLLRGIRRLPGVQRAAAAAVAPLSWGLNVGMPSVNGHPCRPNGTLLIRAVSPSYFRVLGVPLLAGAAFSRGEARPVAIVNQALARRCWPGAQPLGGELWAGKGLGPDYADVSRVIIGVSADFRELGPGNRILPTVYIPVWQVSAKINPFMYKAFLAAIVVRSSRPLPPAAIARLVARAAPEQTVAAVESLTRLLGHRLAPERFLLLLLGVFAGLALLLTAIGFYGLLQFEIARRTREIGVRLALGASPAQVRAGVLRQAAGMVGYGLLAGAVGMWLAARMIASQVGGTPAFPWSVWLGVLLLLALVAFAAAWFPARRASRVDPLTALRYE